MKKKKNCPINKQMTYFLTSSMSTRRGIRLRSEHFYIVVGMLYFVTAKNFKVLYRTSERDIN